MSSKIQIALSGSTGRMGKSITNLILSNGSDFVLNFIWNRNSSLENWDENKIDLILDFSLPESFSLVLNWAKKKNKAFVSGTTGISEDMRNEMKNFSKDIPIFYSENMSYGIWQIKKWLDNLSEKGIVDLEFEEFHHKDKKDRPSGTALSLKKHIPSLLSQNLEIISHREGNELGTHRIKLIGEEEIISLEHKALSRDLFAIGALKAAKWLMNKKSGLYSIEDLYEKDLS